jgi:hypothetical protein
MAAKKEPLSMGIPHDFLSFGLEVAGRKLGRQTNYVVEARALLARRC